MLHIIQNPKNLCRKKSLTCHIHYGFKVVWPVQSHLNPGFKEAWMQALLSCEPIACYWPLLLKFYLILPKSIQWKTGTTLRQLRQGFWRTDEKRQLLVSGTNDLCSNEFQLNAAVNWVENDIHECSWNLTADQILLDVPCKSIQDVSPTYQTALFYVPDEKNCTFLRGLEAPIISDHKHGGAILQRWTARQMQSRLGIFFYNSSVCPGNIF